MRFAQCAGERGEGGLPYGVGHLLGVAVGGAGDQRLRNRVLSFPCEIVLESTRQ